MIETRSGDIVFDDGRRINPGMSLKQLVRVFPEADVPFGGRRARLGMLDIAATAMHVAVATNRKQRVCGVGLQLALHGDERGSSAWSEVREIERRDLQAEWLRNAHVGITTYDWGVVENAYNDRFGYSAIFVVYDRLDASALSRPAPRGVDSMSPDAAFHDRFRTTMFLVVATPIAVGLWVVIALVGNTQSTVIAAAATASAIIPLILQRHKRRRVRP